RVLDHMLFDGLENAYDHKLMGQFAEQTVRKYKFTRENQDEFAIESASKALKAMEEKIFSHEISPVLLEMNKGSLNVTQDECPFRVKFDKIPTLRPAFEKEGTITAANSSSISDGAAALVLAGRSYVEHHQLT